MSQALSSYDSYTGTQGNGNMAAKLTGFKALSSFANNKMDPRLFRNLCDIIEGIQDRYDVDAFTKTLKEFRDHVLRTDNPHETKITFDYKEFINALYAKYKKENPSVTISKTKFIERARENQMFVFEIIRRIALSVYVNQSVKTPSISSHFPNLPSPIFYASTWTPPKNNVDPLGKQGIALKKPVQLNANTLIMTVSIRNRNEGAASIKICTFLNTSTNDELTVEYDGVNKVVKIVRNGTAITQVEMQWKTTFALRWTKDQIDMVSQIGMDIFTSQEQNIASVFMFDRVFFHIPFKRHAKTSTIRYINLYPGYRFETEVLSIMDSNDLL